MADVWGVLAQVAPAATTLTDAYTVPASKRATVNVIVCNRSVATSIRVSHALNGAADAVAQYLLYDFNVDDNNSVETTNFTLGDGDIVRVYSTSGNVTFNVNGIEEDA